LVISVMLLILYIEKRRIKD